MKYIGLIIDLASSLLEIDFRKVGRNLHNVMDQEDVFPRAALSFTMKPQKEDA